VEGESFSFEVLKGVESRTYWTAHGAWHGQEGASEIVDGERTSQAATARVIHGDGDCSGRLAGADMVAGETYVLNRAAPAGLQSLVVQAA
jgi:hypothetical protein